MGRTPLHENGTVISRPRTVACAAHNDARWPPNLGPVLRFGSSTVFEAKRTNFTGLDANPVVVQRPTLHSGTSASRDGCRHVGALPPADFVRKPIEPEQKVCM